jgi:DNA-directed RNA polymerase subunit RPC12/RpoP
MQHTHTYAVETLYHFKCSKCEKWWSISNWTPKDAINCPECGLKAPVIPDRRGFPNV